MKNYRVVGGVAKFGPGQVIALSDKQLVGREHLVAKTADKGVFTASAAIEFKVGEVIGLPTLDKRLAETLALADAPQAARPIAQGGQQKR